MQSWKKSPIYFIFVVAIAFLFSQFASGQTIFYGKVTGTITDDTGEPLPGVTIEAASAALITGTRTAITTDRGTYAFLNLPIGDYTLTATLQGFKTVVQEKVTITAGSAITVDLVMEPGRIEESVTVTAVGPIIDSKSSTVSTTIENELLEKLPTDRNAFFDLVLATPGMTSQGVHSASGWMPSPTAYGGAANENLFLVNGVNATNPRGAFLGSLVQVNYNAVEEVRVIALGTQAEYGNFSGVAVDVLTKSGSNDLHGKVSFYSILGEAANNQHKPAAPGEEVIIGDFGPGEFGHNLFIAAGDDVARYNTQEWEANFNLGGPLIRDKAWFFLSLDYVRSNQRVPFFPIPASWWGRFGNIKISAEPAPSHRAWISYQYENNKNDGTTWAPYWDDTMYYGTKRQVHSIASQWQWLVTGKSVFTAKYLGFWDASDQFLPEEAPANPGFINWWKGQACGVNGAFPYIENMNSNRHTVQADISHYAEDFLGEHDIKFGVQYTSGKSDWIGGYFQNYVNFAYYYRWTRTIDYLQSWYGDTGFIMDQQQFWVDPFLTNRITKQLGFFLDEQWTPTRRLTINLGLRWDRMTAKYGEGKVYAPLATPDLNTLSEVRTRQGTDNVFDFKNLSPRLGITFALTDDMKTILRASYGRYYLPITIENLRRFGPDMPLVTLNRIFHNVAFDAIDINDNGYIDNDEIVLATELLLGGDYIDDTVRPPWIAPSSEQDYSWYLNVAEDLKNQRTDQIILNLERELFSDFSAGLTYIYKRTSDIYVNWPINPATGESWEYDRLPWTTGYGEGVDLYSVVLEDYDESGVVDNTDISYINDVLYGPTPDPNATIVKNLEASDVDGIEPRRIYHGLQFVLRKRFSNRWQMLASFLRSWSDGFAARSKRQDFNVEGPMITDDRWVADPNQTINNMKGPLPLTPKYEFNLSGSYRFPVVEVDLGFRMRYHSGTPVWALQTFPQWAAWMGPTRPTPQSCITTGTDRIVAINPEEPWYLEDEFIIDLRLDKSFKLGDYGNLDIAVDFLNVFNENAVIGAGYGGTQWGVVGQVTGLSYPSRKIRLIAGFRF